MILADRLRDYPQALIRDMAKKLLSEWVNLPADTMVSLHDVAIVLSYCHEQPKVHVVTATDALAVTQ